VSGARLALVLAACVACVVGCGAAGGEQAQKVADEARAKINAYCDARAKALDALGIDGSAAVGLGEAGAKQ